MQSIELTLDGGLDAAVRAQWQALADAGLPSLADHTSPTNAPHITLVTAETMPADVEASLAGVAATLPVPVRLGSLVLFRAVGRVILVRLVVADAPLLDLHARAAAATADLPGDPRQRPGRWTPHVTLAHRLRPAQLPEALEAFGDLPDLTGAAVGARRWDAVNRVTTPLRTPE